MNFKQIVEDDYIYMRDAIKIVEKAIARLKYQYVNIAGAFNEIDNAIQEAWILILLNKGGEKDGRKETSNS